MTAGTLATTGLTPGIHVPRTPITNVNQWTRHGEREVKSSFDFTNAREFSSPLRIFGACNVTDGRRVHSSYPFGYHKTDARELTSLTLKGVYSQTVKKSMEPLPLRPAMTRAKQIPGRYFPKAILSDGQRAAMESVKPKKVPLVPKNKFPPIKGLDFMKTSVSLPPPPVSNPSHIASYNKKIAQTRKSLRVFPEVQTEVFAICFQEDARGDYDPDSELHSDYYTIRRVNTGSGETTKVPPSKTEMRASQAEADDFRIVLRGHRKRLHERADEVPEETQADSAPDRKTSVEMLPPISPIEKK